MLVPLLIAAVVGYLLGSLPFGYLVARAKGVNIFEVGSKSPGATNVRRVLGSGPGNLVLFLDALKGAVAVGWVQLFCFFVMEKNVRVGAGDFTPSDERFALYLSLSGLVAAILGHAFSCFTKFRGGKSVATGAGGFAVLFPMGMAITFGVWLTTLALTRYVSLSSILGAAALPIAAVILKQSTLLVSVSAVISLFVILRHRTNISRLLAGTESKVGRKAPAAPASPS
ncbi:MAG: glycerol-3-phosphate 1-O-acyltransferase PlsY [Opitutaceae bacterium]